MSRTIYTSLPPAFDTKKLYGSCMLLPYNKANPWQAPRFSILKAKAFLFFHDIARLVPVTYLRHIRWLVVQPDMNKDWDSARGCVAWKIGPITK